MRMPESSLVRTTIAVGSYALYGLLFLALYPVVGITAAALNAIPAVLFGWLFGVRGGLLFWLVATPVNTLLIRSVGNAADANWIQSALGTGALALASAGVGWARDLHRRVGLQADDLRAERRLLQEEIERRILAEERLAREALHDPLTGLPNRRLFFDRLEHAHARSKRNPDSLCAVLYLDLDGFKSVNDSLGHEAGDQVLIDVARRLKTSVREVDTVARIGGDEFAVVLEATRSPEDALAIARRVRGNLAPAHEWKGRSFPGGASIGVVLGLTSYERIDDILADADSAMYRAKSSECGGVCVFEAVHRGQREIAQVAG